MEPSTYTGENAAESRDMDAVARFYVKCVLWLGVHDPTFVDAYFGPSVVREEALTVTVPPDRIAGYATDLIATLDRIDLDRLESAGRTRHAYLRGMVRALEARAGIFSGMSLTFDAEAEALFGVSAPDDDPAWYEELHAALDANLPGSGDLPGRYRAFMESFAVPSDRLKRVFAAAFAESRRRIAEHLLLPAGEGIEVGYITGEPWEVCNRYLGSGASHIEVSTDRPVTIDRALLYACHEGYPGHHTMWAIREAALVRGRGWIEHSVVPLASPLATVGEGAARLGVEVAFPRPDRVRFAEEVLFPLAGLDPAGAALLDTISTTATDLLFSGNTRVAREYINGAISREDAYARLRDILLLAPETAETHLRFIEEFRAYPVALSEGYRLVRDYVGADGGGPAQLWERFARILTEPVLPGDLIVSGTSG
ncbi:MAG: hypothetical protein M0P22_11240 [Methanoculleus sp.]|nr:hypothetical protein [Methanoculleus sp.]